MSKLYFDKRDYQLLGIVNDVLNRDKGREYTQRLVYPYLHPRGIKELAETKGLRIAFAVIQLLKSLEAGGVDDRLNALRSLRDEIMNMTGGLLPVNSARVLLQIMKELVRAHGDNQRQLRLAHDFRAAVKGNPRIIRTFLKRYHLLEMPENWNQISFDDHVHDANTKGRKSSSHLIMDAWIKGIRRLRVIYYNYLEARVAVELIEAAQIMGINLRIGIEFSARFRNKYVQLIWVPRGFSDAQDFLCFLAEEPVVQFMSEGRKVSEYQKRHVLATLQNFNTRHRHAIQEKYGFDPPPLSESDFLGFVKTGQASLLHLADFTYQKMIPHMKAHVESISRRYPQMNEEEKKGAAAIIEKMNHLDNRFILDNYLHPGQNPEIPDHHIPQDGPDVPELLTLSPAELIQRLISFRSGYRITLNLTDLKVEDVIELLYDCEGSISRLELFNLKDYSAGKIKQIPLLNTLQRSLNQGNVIQLKRLVRATMARLSISGPPDWQDRVEKLSTVLYDIERFKDLYKGTPLKSRMGSDSTGRLTDAHGMGLAIKDTLPVRAQKEIDDPRGVYRKTLPIRMPAFRRVTFIPMVTSGAFLQGLYSRCGGIPLLRLLFLKKAEDWWVQSQYTTVESPGNIITLGGVQRKARDQVFSISPEPEKCPEAGISWNYLNTLLKNLLKVFFGFIPAFLTFALTKDWWLLAYFGAFIWFGITGVRNIIQSVLGGGGIRRSPLLRWNDYVSWERLADSLLFTGFSVPLLDYLVKTVILDHVFHITIHTNSQVLYTVMALANGLYISSHNVFRGFPKGAVYGNFFRSILSIPIALAFNAVIGFILGHAGHPAVDEALQKWAAVISKAASDLVAGVIEGTADRYRNIGMRLKDYNTKLTQLFDIYAKLELLFPDVKTMQLLKSPRKFISKVSEEIRDLENIILIHSIDLLYFWMYQPRARSALRSLIPKLSKEEREILLTSQFVLNQQRKISLLFVNGLVGKRFSKALSFYLDSFETYLNDIKKMISKD